MCIYKIHLPDIIKTSADSETTVQGITLKEFKHISPRTINISFPVDDARYKETYGFNLSDGEISNFLFHREIWKRFLETGLPWCLIIESNVHLTLSDDELNPTVAELPDDWDLFFPFDLEEQVSQKKKESIEQNLLNVNHWEIGRNEPYLLGYKLGNSIYMISQAGAVKLLSIKKIEDRLDHTIISMLDNNGLNAYSADVDWFNTGLIEDYNWPDRCQLIYDMALEQSSWNGSRLEKARKLLRELSDIAIENNINLMLEAGTLLGYIRHGGIMKWDDDIDIAIEEKDLEPFFAQVRKHGNLQYDDRYRFRGTRYFKVWDIDGEKIEGYEYTYPFVDVWVYKYIEIGRAHV